MLYTQFEAMTEPQAMRSTDDDADADADDDDDADDDHEVMFTGGLWRL